MKVIGVTARGAIIEASTEEICRILGVDDAWGLDSRKGMIANPNAPAYERVFKIGTVIQVSPMWDWMTKARETFKKIEDTGKLLFGLAEVLAHAPPPALMEPVKPVKIEIVEAERPE